MTSDAEREPPEVELVDDPEDETDGPERVWSSELVGRGGRDRIAAFFERTTERLARVPLRMRVASALAGVAVLALAVAFWPRPAAAPTPVRLHVLSSTFGSLAQQDGLTLTVVLANDSSAKTVLYASTISIDGLEQGTTPASPVGTISAHSQVTLTFALPYDCVSGGTGALSTPRTAPTRFVVFASDSHGVLHDVDVPFANDPWARNSKARSAYCHGVGPNGLAFSLAGITSEASPTTHSFTMALDVRNTTDHQILIDYVSHPSDAVRVDVPVMPRSIPPGTAHATLAIRWTVLDCSKVGPSVMAVPHLDVHLIAPNNNGGNSAVTVVEPVQIPTNEFVTQLQKACADS